jgi:ribosomal protein S18 acetylase RimI-like enzyme
MLRPIEVERAGRMLANSFRHDRIWLNVFGGVTRFFRRYRAFFEIPLQYGLKYGDVYATSRELEGIAAWLPGDDVDMTPLRMILSGAIMSSMYVGPDVLMKMGPLAEILPLHRNKHMAGRDFRYLLLVGVAMSQQRKGIGSAMIRALLARCDRDEKWLYLETESEDNVRFYERLGFQLLEKVVVPEINLPMWLMAREPGDKGPPALSSP